METRSGRFLALLDQKKIESAFITSRANVFYLTGYDTDPHERLVAVYVDHKGEPVLILPKMEEKDAQQSGWTSDTLTYTDDQNPWELFGKQLKDQNRTPAHIAVEKDHMTLERKDQLAAFLPSSQFIAADELLRNLRVIKDTKEYTTLKQAAALADLGVKTGIEALAEGKTELELVAEIEYALKKEGVREMSFSTLVLTGDKTASPHGNPGLHKVKSGDMVLFDLGVVFEGYCSDITRTVAFNEISEKQLEIYETVLKAQKASIEQSVVGTPVGKIDLAARNVIEQAGYGEYFTHRIGHGIGVEVHEHPSMHSQNNLPLQEGMSYTIEPGIYMPNVGGVRIEDEIFITKNGPEILTKYPKDIQIIK